MRKTTIAGTTITGAMALILMAGTSQALAAPAVVASIKPVHALVSAVMAGVGEPTLLVSGSASPHTYALRPSDAGNLQNAEIVFWTGHGMETFLEDALDSLAPGATTIALSQIDGLTLLPTREGGAFEPHAHDDEHDHAHDDAHDHDDHDHDHDHDHDDHAHDDDHHDHDHGAHDHAAHDHDDHGHDDHSHDDHDHDDHSHDDHAHHDHAHGGPDMHFWLDPDNAALMVDAIARSLAEADPENAKAYEANAEAERGRLAGLAAELEAELAPVADRPFIVFHDAYQYFEQRFGLSVAGSVTVSPEIMPGAQRINQLRARVADAGAVCIFAEPQFEPAIIAAIAEGSALRTGILDPEGADLEPGADLYAALLRGLSADLVDCLSATAP